MSSDTSNSQAKSKLPARYFNRELSWLAFNERVLDQAYSDKYPLLERTRFLSFVSSNLDQFYEIRVSGLMQKVDAGITKPSIDGSRPDILLKKVRTRAHAMSQKEYECWSDHLQPELAKEGITFKNISKLSKNEFVQFFHVKVACLDSGLDDQSRQQADLQSMGTCHTNHHIRDHDG